MQPDTARHRLRSLAVVALALPALTVGCGDDTGTAAIATTAAAAASTTVGGSDTTSPDTTSPDTTSPDTTDASGATTRVNANDASVEELAAAFEAAGIPNAARWAHEVEEYRPYSDDGWAHLRQELSKYNIDDATFEQIVATLEL
jgi:DNA uptake protein ComE-like DNA-binding protein